MAEARIVDSGLREQALVVDRSFIVQAPAGSGKTTLLTQRYLALLATVDQPEEVLAITFTRKAAAEMRHRVLDALDLALGEQPDEAYMRSTWSLAQLVVARDAEREWNLADNPLRLRISTIDALCTSLVRQMPVLSRFGASPRIAKRPERMYREAARRLLRRLENSDVVSGHIAAMMVHLDNDLARAERLLINMLASRDRWLRHVVGSARPDLDKAAIEAALEDSVKQVLTGLAAALPSDLGEELVALAAYAADHDSGMPENSPLRECAGLDAIPSANPDRLPLWRGLRELALTFDGKVRSDANVRIGFPPPSSASTDAEKARRRDAKERLRAVLAQVAELPDLQEHLQYLDGLPDPQISASQWQVFEALRDLLPVAVAEFKLICQEAGEVDYTEMTHRAIAALGEPERPTDLALQLDYRIQHLLVDEFQDTSRSQFDLIEKLVAGWQPGDGRSVFLVGDPMQSVYRFREADVGLFLFAREKGVGALALTPLNLQTNFRSRTQLVEWANDTFIKLFPDQDDWTSGAVSYHAASAARGGDRHAGVHMHALGGGSEESEAVAVADIAAAAHVSDRSASTAILVRSRSHLRAILPELRRRGMRYQALEIESLASQPIVQDLYALTRALMHLGDRVAWLSILRAQWCGLKLRDLHALAAGQHGLTIWELIINETRREALSDDGQLRLSRLKSVLAQSLSERGRRDLRRWVEGTWAGFGGDACVTSATEYSNAQAYFELLEGLGSDGDPDDLEAVEEGLAKLFASPDTSADDALQVMTIHKAKGLEFDTVIVPGLDRETPSDPGRLLMWLEQTGSEGERQLLLAPIHPIGGQDSVHNYLNIIDRQRDRLEQLRLIYVAATRARESLHLVARCRLGDAGLKKPVRSSLLARIWPVVEERFASACEEPQDDGLPAPVPPTAPAALRRVPSAWMLPETPQPKPWRATEAIVIDEERIEFRWAGETARHVGTVVHRVLQQVAAEGAENWISRWSESLGDYLYRMLAMLGVPASEIDDATSRARAALENCLADDRGRWIVAAHDDARSEFAVSGWLDGRLRNMVIDRTFVEDGRRWIIDYKTGAHQGGTVDAFLDGEMERYLDQLERYAKVMQRMDAAPIELGLYFPMVQGWRTWSYRG